MNSLPTALPQADAGFQPYIGLKPFTEQEKDRFFGRDREISILFDKIRANRLTLLLAASGVGKSSLLQAGIMPALREDSNIELIYHRDWAASPQAFKQAVSDHYGEPHKDNVSLKSILRACTLFSSGQQIILLDQFEEFFNYQRFRTEFLPFIEELSAAILDRSLPASFVFSMREDFALELNSFKPFLPGVFDSYFRLEKLTRDQARLAIEEPLKPTGWRFEQDGSKSLLEEVLNDLAKREQERQFGVQELLNLNELPLLVEPPHLQIVCHELWQNHRDDTAKQITQKAYQEAGRTAGILNSYFLRKISSFSEKEQRIASAAFDHLIGEHRTKVAHPLNRLAELTKVDKEKLQAVLDRLQDNAIIYRQKRDNEIWYELYHDIFSESIERWNKEFQTKRRIRQMARQIEGHLLYDASAPQTQQKLQQALSQILDEMSDYRVYEVFPQVAFVLNRIKKRGIYSEDDDILEKIRELYEGVLKPEDFVSFINDQVPVKEKTAEYYIELANHLCEGKVALCLGQELSSLLGGSVPSTDQIIDTLSQENSFYGTLSEICEQMQISRSGTRFALVNKLSELLKLPPHSISLYELIAQIDLPLLIISTAYDDFLEHALLERRKFVVIFPDLREEKCLLRYSDHQECIDCTLDELSCRRPLENGYTVIYKLRGGVIDGRDTLLLSERDYLYFGAQQQHFPNYILQRLRCLDLWFLGHYPMSWEERLLVRVIQAKRGMRSSALTVQQNISTFGRNFWRDNDVQVIDLTVSEFVQKLAKEMEA